MAKTKRVVTTAADLVRKFSRYSDVALQQPVIVTKNGKPRNVLLSVDEYERLKKRDRQVYLAHEIPDYFVADMEAFLRSKKR